MHTRRTESRAARARISAHETTSGAGGFQPGLGINNYFISSQQAVGSSSSFSGRAGDEDGSIAASDEEIMEVHAEQTRGNGGVGIEMSYNNLLHDEFHLRARIGIEPNPRALVLCQCSSHIMTRTK